MASGRNKTKEDDVYFEIFHHPNGKVYDCIYQSGLRRYQDDSKKWQPFPMPWYKEGVLETVAVIKDDANKELANAFSKLKLDKKAEAILTEADTAKAKSSKPQLSAKSVDLGKSAEATVYSQETASDEFTEHCFNPENPFRKGSSPDEIELKFDDGQSLFPSQSFLTQASPIFEELFRFEHKGTRRKCIELKGKNYKAFLDMLLNLHPRIQKPLPDTAITCRNIYEYAQEYKIPPVLDNCETILLRKIPESSVRPTEASIRDAWDMLLFTEKCRNDNISSRAVEYISTMSFKSITGHPDYNKLSDATKNRILTRRLEKNESRRS